MFVSDILQMERRLYGERAYTVFLSLFKKVSFKDLFAEKVSFIKKNVDSHKSKISRKDLKVIRQLFGETVAERKKCFRLKGMLDLYIL